METNQGGAQSESHTLVGLLADVINRGASAAEILAFVQVMERQQAREDKQAYVGAMVEFKQTIQTVIKDADAEVEGENGPETWAWATLGQICERIVAELAKVGIIHSWVVEQPHDGMDAGLILVTTVLTHQRGYSTSATVKLPPDSGGQRNRNQSIGSSLTYGERYSLLAAVGIATKEQPDDDGRGGAGANSPLPAGVPPEDKRQPIDDAALARGLAAIKEGTYKWESMVGFYRLTDAQLARAKKELNLP